MVFSLFMIDTFHSYISFLSQNLSKSIVNHSDI